MIGSLGKRRIGAIDAEFIYLIRDLSCLCICNVKSRNKTDGCRVLHTEKVVKVL